MRRGIHTADAGRAFLAADESHDPSEFSGIDAVVNEIVGSIDAGQRITVYGDFDADGVAATSVMVGVLRELGADCDWFIPDRISEGYGLNPNAIRTLKDRGTGLIVTVDCGVTAVEEVALAMEIGLKIVITDHHQPDESLPECLILHPEVCGYPFKELCGTAVAAKLASALRRSRGIDVFADEKDLDLVALATVTDVMPLLGENRRLVKEGVKVARRAERVGMRALMAASRVNPASLAAEDFGFRLGPRINAAGRMYRADAGVELFLADNENRAAEIGDELGRANLERRRVEREVGTAAEAARRALEDPHPSALVVAGEAWHPGVVGIVAATLSRRHGVPAVVIAIDGDSARGSARGVPGLDLYRAIDDCSDHLRGFGGHRAAAGLQIDPANIDAFRRDLAVAVTAQLGDDPQIPPPEVDVILGGSDISMELAEDLEKLAPFGNENPAIAALVPGSRITDIREMGDGKHARFSLESGKHRAKVVSFNRTAFGVEETQDVDVLARLTVNRWNGNIEPQLQLLEVWPVAEPEPEVLRLANCESDEWWSRFEAASSTGSALNSGSMAGFDPDASAGSTDPGGGARRQAHEGRGSSFAEIADLISSGSRLAIVTADAARRWSTLGGSSGLGRFREGVEPVGIWEGSPSALARDLPDTGVLLTDWQSLAVRGLTDGFDVVAILDPAPSFECDRIATHGEGLRINLWRDSELSFAIAAAEYRLGLKVPLRELYRLLSGAASEGEYLVGEELRRLLCGDPDTPFSPEFAAVMCRVLEEAEIAHLKGEVGARQLGIVSSKKTDLSISPTFVASEGLGKEAASFLKSSKK